jgi:hypothetical protein
VEVGTLRQIFGSNPLQITILICWCRTKKPPKILHNNIKAVI